MGEKEAKRDKRREGGRKKKKKRNELRWEAVT